MRAGDELPTRTFGPVSAEKMKILAAVLRDPNPIHWDRTEVEHRQLGSRLINQGPANLAYVTTMLASASGGHDRLRRLRVRFVANVFEDDYVDAGGRVREVVEGEGERLAVCDVWLDRVDGERVISGEATLLIS